MARTSYRYYSKSLYMALGREHHQLHARIARLTVLYEDLRLELLAAAEDEMKFLDQNGINFRKQYFMRRAFGTTHEFAEEFRLLNDCPDFEIVRSQFPAETVTEWNDCVGFFAEHEHAIEKIRNDVGGHFGFPVALSTVRTLTPDQEGMIKLRFDLDARKGRIFYEFAGEIAASAMMRHKQPGETSDVFFRRTLEMLLECFRKAIRTTDLISNYDTIDRFR